MNADVEPKREWIEQSIGPNISHRQDISNSRFFVTNFLSKSHSLFTKYQSDGKEKHNLHKMILLDIPAIHKIYSKCLIQWKI